MITGRDKEENKMKEYIVNCRERGNKKGQVFETSVTADNIKKAEEYAREDLDKCYVIIKIRLA